MLCVLTYHRVAPICEESPLDQRLISATPEVFAKQMSYLAKYYNVVCAETVLKSLETGAPLPKRAVMITFDDGYCDFAECAWPILKYYGLSATLFIPTAYPGRPELAFWWDRLHCTLLRSPYHELSGAPFGTLPLRTRKQRFAALRRLQVHVKSLPHAEAMKLVDDVCERLSAPTLGGTVLSWDELRALVQQGLTIASHTRTHPILTRVSAAHLCDEIAGSRHDLQRELGNVLPIFCYPNGSHDDEVTSVVREAGYQMAFTGLDGHNDLTRTDPLRLRRTNITRRTSPAVFRLRLTRVFTYIDAWRHRSGSVSAVADSRFRRHAA
jgi:peptidoglycan/xylan/chitin deacetylase (PgdA/CDA1 family)